MLIHQDRLKYRARRLGVIPYITHNMSGLLKNHQHYISLRDQIEFGPGTKSNLGPRPNRIWTWDQIEFGPGTKSNLGLGPNRIWAWDQIEFGPKTKSNLESFGWRLSYDD